jgi:hypothetical protein
MTYSMQLFYSAYVTLSALKFLALFFSQTLPYILRPIMPFQKKMCQGIRPKMTLLALKSFMP